ncbi:hypothetical protein Tco_0443406 [Tanacetum coccineum]
MSGPTELNLSPPTSAVRNTMGKGNEQILKNLNRPASDAALREFCDKHYHQLLQIIAKKVHQEKMLQEMMKEHDFTVIDSQRAVTFRDKYGVQMVMRFNEIHKFSDGTLQQNDEALDYRVKEFKVNRINPGLNTWFSTRKDVDRSKEFMFAIQKWLKTRKIFQNLESFVGGRIREGDYRLLKRTE